MKYVLVIILCSGYQGMCLDPFAFPEKYDDVYSCLMDGYQKSIEKTEELDILAIVSGPEPQRSIFEELLNKLPSRRLLKILKSLLDLSKLISSIKSIN